MSTRSAKGPRWMGPVMRIGNNSFAVRGSWFIVRRATDNRQLTTDRVLLPVPPVPRSASAGFTLLEMMVVLTLILVLASLAMPTYRVAIIRAREAVLRDDLYTMRKLIDEFTLDKQHPPATLDELVEAGYLRGGVPIDPFTGSNQTWQVVSENVPISLDQSLPGIVDVHSGSTEMSLEGTPYSSW